MAAPIAPAREAEAADLTVRAEGALDAGRVEEALRLATRVVDELPSSAVSGRALLVQARAAATAQEWPVAEGAAERYVDLVPDDHPLVPELLVIRAEAAVDRPDTAVERLADLGALDSGSLASRTVAVARVVVMDASPEALQRAIDRSPEDGTARPVLEARLGALALGAGEDARAAALARAALGHGAVGPDAVLANALLGGALPEGYVASRSVTLAAVLPLQGAPALASFSRLVLEGVEVAAASLSEPGLEIVLEARDDGGDPQRTAEVVRALEAEGVAGIVGFLQEVALDVAAEARLEGVPLVSPTARATSFGQGGIYSLEGVDPSGLHELARYAASRGYQRVAFIESTSPLSAEEADLFAAELLQFGIPTVGRFRYAEGATFFEPQIRSARDALRRDEIAALGLTEEDTLRVELLDPVALFVPTPGEDVELLAPQITHFGLDTLGIEVLGTSGWTDGETLRRVDARHTNRVVATAPLGAAGASPGYERFRAAYEEHFRRTLVSPVPAVGYDAALLLLEAVRRGARTPREVVEVLERLEDVEGATGVFSVIDGRVVRRSRAVRIENKILTPIPTG